MHGDNREAAECFCTTTIDREGAKCFCITAIDHKRAECMCHGRWRELIVVEKVILCNFFTSIFLWFENNYCSIRLFKCSSVQYLLNIYRDHFKQKESPAH